MLRFPGAHALNHDHVAALGKLFSGRKFCLQLQMGHDPLGLPIKVFFRPILHRPGSQNGGAMWYIQALAIGRLHNAAELTHMAVEIDDLSSGQDLNFGVAGHLLN